MQAYPMDEFIRVGGFQEVAFHKKITDCTVYIKSYPFVEELRKSRKGTSSME